MNDMVRWTAQTQRRAPRTPEVRSTMVGALGGLAMTLVLAIGVAVAVVFAATLALVMLLTTVLLALSALAWRVRPRPVAQRSAQPALSGHAWIAYGQDRTSR